MKILEVKDLSISFGGLRAVSNFKMTLEKGGLTGLIGPNGAGKTTVFNMLTGVYLPSEGEIFFNNNDNEQQMTLLNKKKPYQIAKLGICRTFQNIRLFRDMNVLDNVLVASHFNMKYNALQSTLRTTKFYVEEEAAEVRAMKLLDIFKLSHKAEDYPKNMPYGEQRRLEIVRALATSPKLLLLDEPAAGMNPQETQELMKLICFIRDEFDLTILLIEHDMHLVMNICENITVLDYGSVIALGKPEEISKNPEVIKAYLGEEAHNDA